MARIILIICLVAGSFFAAGKFGSQPPAPRLLQADDFIWKLFARCQIKSERDFSYGISYIPEVKAMNGRRVAISGFMVPLEAKGKFSHFLLSRRPPTCAFCPPGEPNEIVEVFSAQPVSWQENLVTVSGALVLTNDGKKGIFFQLKDTV